ncbi:DMT family transporter [Streptomyces klenkii]|uniref:DMT family transporter n=1 Tax=Streptomyces klenkii TaxID=1420899 RepID=UPI0033A80AF5
MTLAAILAFLNGLIIGTSRALNGRLSAATGPLTASLWNHATGFTVLTAALATLTTWQFPTPPPPAAYLGGLFGALFVAANSHVMHRIGATRAALLVISGQMICAVLLDWHTTGTAPATLQYLGVAAILTSIRLARPHHPKDNQR